MKKAKLTLTIDPGLLAKTKQLAKERGASLSGLIEDFFERLLEQKKDASGKAQGDPWVAQMDKLLDTINSKVLSQKDILKEIDRDHDDFEKELIEDRSKEFLK